MNTSCTTDKPKPIKVLCIMPNRSWTVGDIRLKFPLQKLCDLHPEKYCITYKAVFDLMDADFENVTVVIIQRMATPFMFRLAKLLLKNQICYVYEIDDFLLDVPRYLVSAKAWKRQRQRLIYLLQNASAVTTTTELLAEKLKKYNKNVFAIPNCLPEYFVQNPNHNPAKSLACEDLSAEENRCNILIAATDNMPLSHLVSPLSKIQKKSNVCITIVSPTNNIIGNNDFRFEKLNIMDFSEFSAFLSTRPFKFALLPLDGSDFSQCKSPIKFFHYAAAGIPVIADNEPPYSDVIKHGETGWLVKPRSEAEWFAAINMFLDNKDLTDKIRKNYLTMNYPSLSNFAERWNELFQKLLSNSSSFTGKIHLPSGFDISFVRYIFTYKKYKSLLKLIKEHGFNVFPRLFRKGM